MLQPTLADSFEVICLQAGDNGRADILFGDSLQRARTRVRPFMVGEKLPDVYLEFPLIGDGFLDVTVLYNPKKSVTRIESHAVDGTEAMLDWCAGLGTDYEDVSWGYELDTSKPELPEAAVHFQPRMHTELVMPFCESLGEPHRAELYLDLAKRMPKGWPLSFFGMFRGRPSSPLRVCGYLSMEEQAACAHDTGHLAEVFESLGFVAFDEAMLAQVSEVMATAPGTVDFQFDVLDDGSLGSMFAIDAQFAIEQPEAVMESFEHGGASRVMGLLEGWGVADERWHLGGQAAFGRALPVECADGSLGRYAFTLMPQWVKIRWRDAKLQPSKLYLLGGAGLLDD